MTYEDAIRNAMGISVMSGEEHERLIVREANARAPKCSAGHATTYNHGVGAYRCESGALIRANGEVIRSCQR
jgi:hypothetical protein